MPGKLVSRMSKRECYTLRETDTIKTASQNLHEKKVGCMPILDTNKIVVGTNDLSNEFSILSTFYLKMEYLIKHIIV